MARRGNDPATVLILRLSALGDVAMTIPVVYPVCRANPGTRFVLVTREWPAGMMVDAPDNLTVLGIDPQKDYKGLRGMLRLSRELRREHGVTAVADLHSVLRTWVVDACMALQGTTVSRIDKQRWRRRALLRHQPGASVTPTIERYRLVFERLGLAAPKDGFTRLFDGKPLPTSELLPDKGEQDRWVAISPLSAHPGKVYPLPLMKRVVDQMAKLPRVRVFLMGGGHKEASILQKLAGDNTNITSMADLPHTFTDEFALLGRCDVMISMDSANMHLASLMGVPVVSVWGATSPACGFMGYGQSESNAVQLNLACRPCGIWGERACRHGDYRCLDRIDPQHIAARAIRLLESGERDHRMAK